jgi:UDP-N-acetylglucosamine:LPS N-acetylglucosamine transferase
MGKRVIISGGGTGGHIFPAVAIANALKKIDPSTEILFVGANGRMEMEKGSRCRIQNYWFGYSGISAKLYP